MAVISNKAFGITDQAASTNSNSNKAFGITDQAGGGPKISNKALDEIGNGIFGPYGTRARVLNRAHTQPGGPRVQVNGVDVALQQQVNFLSSNPTRPKVSGSSTVAGVGFSLTPDSLTPEVGILARIPGVNLLSGGTTPLLTTPGREIVVLGCTLLVTAAAGVTQDAVAGIGNDSPPSNIFEQQTLSGLREVGDVYEFPPGGTFTLASPPLESVSLGVGVPGAGTTLVVEALLFGYVRNS